MVKKVPELVVMVGVPGSGKTTMASHVYDNHVILSSDLIRKELFGDESFQGNNELMFEILQEQVREQLLRGNSVVCDATNISPGFRESFIDIADQCNANVVAHCMKVSTDTCVQRNNSMDRAVPENVIKGMSDDIQWPTLDEGFDEIRVSRR